jgi:4-amino-4-deoxy-L-arabinose transferase-like glycosyltransferase
MPARRAAFDRSTLAFLVILIGMTWLRIAFLRVSPLDLGYDEAQYWAWSQTLAWGYFSKPPLIAWAISATTNLFGTDAEWAVRLISPIGHAIAACALVALGRMMYGAWAGFWAGVGWLFMPAIWLSSAVISTDVLLLPLWALGLCALWQMTASRAWIWAIVLGVVVGVGLQAKYAMLYFPLCAGFAAWWSKPVRAALAGGRGVVAALIALAIIAPNLYWNATHGFATAEHTLANARFDERELFSFSELNEFITSQFGVVGPLLLLALLWLFFRASRRSSGLNDQDQFLLAFTLPMLILMVILSFLSRANANWAAASYPAALVWIAGNLVGSIAGRRFLAAALVVNIAIGAYVGSVLMLNPAMAVKAKGVRTSTAWNETAHQIAVRAIAQPDQAPFTAVMVDDRAMFYELQYYWRHARRAGAPLPPVRMWLLNDQARNSAESSDPMRPEEGGRVLVVHMTSGYVPLIAGDFTVFRRVEHLSIPLGGRYSRELELSVGEGYARAPRDATFTARLRSRT